MDKLISYKLKTEKKHYLLDETILSGLINRNKREENLFYTIYRKELIRYASKICRNKEDAEDLVQNAVIITILRIRAGAFIPTNEKHLLNSIKTTIRFNYYNLQRKSQTEFELRDIDTIDDDDDDFKRHLLQATEEALLLINKKCREILIATTKNKMSMKEVVEEFKITTVGVARNIKYRCVKELKSIALTLLKDNLE